MSDEEHSDSEFYYPEEQETAERKASRLFLFIYLLFIFVFIYVFQQSGLRNNVIK